MLRFHYNIPTQFLNKAMEIDRPFVMSVKQFQAGKVKHNSLRVTQLKDVFLSDREYKIEGTHRYAVEG